MVALNGIPSDELLALAAATERYSEHPLAEAVRAAQRASGVCRSTPTGFEFVPGQGVRAQVEGHTITIGNRRMIGALANVPVAADLEAQGKTLLFVARNDELAGALAAADTICPEIAVALADMRRLGVRQIEVLTWAL